MEGRYLVELDQHREKTAVRRAFVCSFLLNNLIIDLGLSPDACWVILEFPKPSGNGDIDVLLGPLTVSSTGWFSWPSCHHHLAALEVKVGYLRADSAGAPKVASAKGGPGHEKRIRGQLASLVGLGLNRIALLDIIATPPATGKDGEAWFVASANALAGLGEAQPVLSRRPLPETFIGHWAWPWGSVEGGLEHFRGAGAPQRIRPSLPNTFIADPMVEERRRNLVARVSGFLSDSLGPQISPYAMVYCPRCRRLHLLDSSARLEGCEHEAG